MTQHYIDKLCELILITILKRSKIAPKEASTFIKSVQSAQNRDKMDRAEKRQLAEKSKKDNTHDRRNVKWSQRYRNKDTSNVQKGDTKQEKGKKI